MKKISRRGLLAAGGCSMALGTQLIPEQSVAQQTNLNIKPLEAPSFRYCLNTSTIRGQKLGLVQEIEIAAKAGYQAIEPWIQEIEQFVDDGGNLKDVKKRLDDHGLAVESAIGFANWIVDDDQQRATGLRKMRGDMELLREIGGKRIAAPPVGATDNANLNLSKAAERYRAVLELGESTGIVPQAELWGFSKSLSRLGEVMFMAVESGHSSACLLPDVYHIYKGGSDFNGLGLINGQAIKVFHMNDYPDIPRSRISDADRVYPGDGIAPLASILQTLQRIGCHAVLSLELFNRGYWEQDALPVAQTGLQKMRDSVAAAFA